MAFRFKDKERPRGYTSKLGGMLHVSGGGCFCLVVVFSNNNNLTVCLIIHLINAGVCEGPLHFLCAAQPLVLAVNKSHSVHSTILFFCTW